MKCNLCGNKIKIGRVYFRNESSSWSVCENCSSTCSLAGLKMHVTVKLLGVKFDLELTQGIKENEM